MIERNAEYTRIGRKLIRSHPWLQDLKDSGAKIAFLESDEEKMKSKTLVVHADCNLVSSRYRWCCKYDFFIVVYAPNVIDFSPEQMEILLLHELMHCGVDSDGIEQGFYVKPHDVEDFRAIIDKYGLDWSDVNAERGESKFKE